MSGSRWQPYRLVHFVCQSSPLFFFLLILPTLFILFILSAFPSCSSYPPFHPFILPTFSIPFILPTLFIPFILFAFLSRSSYPPYYPIQQTLLISTATPYFTYISCRRTCYIIVTQEQYKKILLLVLGGSNLVCRSPPILQDTAGNRRWFEEIDDTALRRSIRPLYNSKLLNARQNADGTCTLILTEKGRQWALITR